VSDAQRGAAPAAHAADAPPPIVSLDEAECREVLRRQRLCVISLVDAGAPYAVPLYYGFDGESLYLGVSEGRKTRVLDADPLVYLTVIEAGEGDRWRSVAVFGRAATVSDPEERARAIDVLIAHNRRPERPASGGETAPPRRRGGRIIRILDPEITGRARR
jgi:uncharacterized protein